MGMVAQGAVSEADRHNIRGERISVDTIPLVGEDQLADAVRAVARLHRARVLVLAGALMGGDISNAVREIREAGIIVLCTNMAGSVPDAADLVVSDPVEAGIVGEGAGRGARRGNGLLVMLAALAAALHFAVTCLAAVAARQLPSNQPLPSVVDARGRQGAIDG